MLIMLVISVLAIEMAISLISRQPADEKRRARAEGIADSLAAIEYMKRWA